jgi:hypothetical protein
VTIELTKQELEIIKAALEQANVSVKNAKPVVALYEKVLAELKGQGE